MQHISTRMLFILLFVLCILGAGLWSLSLHLEVAAINSYADCAKAGYPILDSYPSQCRTPDGRSFVNPDEHIVLPVLTPEPETASSTSSVPDCIVGGCSGEICGDAADGPAVSTCIYKPQYACYKQARCERQADGACGWTATYALKRCLASSTVTEENQDSPQ